MTDEPVIPEYARPRTPEEHARLEEARRKVAELGPLPEGVEIDFGFGDAGDMVAQVAATDAAVFVKAKAFEWFEMAGLPRLPGIEIDGPSWIEEYIAAGGVTCDGFGIGNEIGGEPVALFAHFRLNIVPLYIWIDEAPKEWLADALEKSGRFMVLWPPRPGGERVWMATGPLNLHPGGVELPGRSMKPGRNDPCPCGSGRKWKRCHGARS